MAFECITPESKEKMLDAAADGKTLEGIAQAAGIDKRTLFDFRRANPEFAARLEETLLDGAFVLLDKLRAELIENLSISTVNVTMLNTDEARKVAPSDLGLTRIDPALARIKLEAMKFYLEKRWPKIFGAKIDVNIKQTIDIRGAIARAKERVVSQVIEGQVINEALSTDSQSVDNENAPALTFFDLV